MRDTSILSEINTERHKRRARLKYYIVLILAIPLLLMTVVSAISKKHQSNDVARPTSTLNTTASSHIEPQDKASSTPESTSLASPASLTPTPSADNAKIEANNMAIINAKLCKDMFDSAIAINANNNALYQKSWGFWTTTYAGRYETPEAEESKQWYKSNALESFNRLVSESDPKLQEICKSTTSLSEALIQPDYSKW